MKVRVPIIFHANVKYKRARKIREETFGFWHEVSVSEVTDYDAPVAIRWNSDPFSDQYTKMESNRVELRYYEGKLYQPILRRWNECYQLTAEELGDFKHPASRKQIANNISQYDLSKFLDGSRGDLNPVNFSAFDASDREVQLRNAEVIASNTLIVDGTVWTTCEEPKYLCYFDPCLEDVRLTIEPAPKYNRNVFRLDRFDDLKEFISRHFGIDLNDDKRADIFIPDAISYEDELPALYSSMANLLEQIPNLQTSPAASIAAWVELRDAHGELTVKNCEEAIERALTAAQVYISVGDLTEEAIKKANFALDRWNSRPVRSDELEAYLNDYDL